MWPTQQTHSRIPSSSKPERSRRIKLKTHRRFSSTSTAGLNSQTGQISRAPNLTTTPARATTLACPYYKHNPAAHQSCARLKLSKISYVKQHLVRQHIVPTYCPRCLEIFSESEDFREHLSQIERCEERLGTVEGITKTMKEQLSRRADQSASEADQWRDIWKLIFGREPPATPYIDLGFSEEINWYNDYLLRQVPIRLSSQGVSQEIVQGAVEEVAREWKDLWQQGRVKGV
ncbi:hypothetical protein F5Y08DRAFT_343484 [Xylaria arbuscula]|nr:hypothetical protein F5Y08DRAFT_343484 [Xylaria arbuscula]